MINIAEKLKNAPVNFKLYSPIYGAVSFIYVNEDIDDTIVVDYYDCERGKEYEVQFDKFGKKAPSGECLLFPSKRVQHWDNFTLGEAKKEYNFKPFDKVIVRDGNKDKWRCDFFSHITVLNDDNGEPYDMYECIYDAYYQCLPYNEKTAKLIGTDDNYYGN